MTDTHVYFLGIVPRGPIKIGLSQNPARRSAELLLPFESKILVTKAGDFAIEQALHAKFLAHHIRGEWFQRERVIMALIARIRAGESWPADIEAAATASRLRRVPQGALQSAIVAAGGGATLARKLGVKRSAVYQWPKCPVQRVLDVERLSGVPRHELRPDIYPPPAKKEAR